MSKLILRKHCLRLAHQKLDLMGWRGIQTGKSRKQNSQIGSAAKEVGKEIGRAVGEEVKKEVKRAVTEKAKKAAGKLLRNLLN